MTIVASKKPCVKCGETNRRDDGRCRTCIRNFSREYKRANREKVNAYARKYQKTPARKESANRYARTHRAEGVARQRKYNFGITTEDFSRMLLAQSGRCPICAVVLDIRNGYGNRADGAHVDHDHKTGIVRGILCRSCNVGIGHLRDDPKRMRAAIAYLEAAEAEQKKEKALP